jgi:hypothetical protein
MKVPVLAVTVLAGLAVVACDSGSSEQAEEASAETSAVAAAGPVTVYKSPT